MNPEPNPSSTTASNATATPDQNVPMPVWLAVLTPVLFIACAIYFDRNGGWFDAQVYPPYRSLGELQLYQPPGDEESGQFEAGRMVFSKTCVACHQASGLGTPGQFPPLVGSDWVNEAQPGRMIRIVLNGLQGPITVKGQNFNNVMVPWKALSDEDLAAVITFVRQNRDWGNKASAVTPEQVKAVREKIKARVTSFTPDELLKISPAD